MASRTGSAAMGVEASAGIKIRSLGESLDGNPVVGDCGECIKKLLPWETNVVK